MTHGRGLAPLAWRRALAFGTPIREGIERIREVGSGISVVLAWDSVVEANIADGLLVNRPVSDDAIVRGARDDNATIVTSDLRWVKLRSATLNVERRKDSTAEGARHGSAEAFTAKTGRPVVVVSESLGTISLYTSTGMYRLLPKEDLRQRLEDALRALQTLAGVGEPCTEQSDEDRAEARLLLDELGGHVVELGETGAATAVSGRVAARRLGIEWQVPAPSGSPLTSEQLELSPPDRPDWLVDRDVELAGLRHKLVNGTPGVLVVRGARGIGKTTLVNTALRSQDTASVRVERHDVNAVSALDVATLVDLVAGTGSDESVDHRGSSLVRLEKTLRRLGDSRVVITVDSAENLVDQATRRLLDPDLDDALDMIVNDAGHRVTVLLVTRHELRSSADGIWPDAGDQIPVGMLPSDEFEHYLTSLDGTGRTDLADLSEAARTVLHNKLQGNPRMAELAYAVVVENDELDFDGLVAMLRTERARDVGGLLTRLLVQSMNPLRTRVVQGLAALGTAVPEAAVVQLLDDEPPARVVEALAALSDDRVVYRLAADTDDDRFVVPPDDGRVVLEYMDGPARSDLCIAAARVLTDHRHRRPTSLADLRVHFAGLRARVLAGPPDSAFEMLEYIDTLLRRWNREGLLLPQRLEFRETLTDEHYRIANENAIGGIYVARGEHADYLSAGVAYENALKLGGAPQNDLRALKIMTNRAQMYLQTGRTDHALHDYQFILDEIDRSASPQTHMAALEGMADCYRRRGRYSWAIQCAKDARAIPDLAGYPDTEAARDFAVTRQLNLDLKLARWHAELGQPAEAERFIVSASALTSTEPGRWLRAAVLDGRADLFLNQDELGLAAAAAEDAVAEALTSHNPVILLQARTTLCLVYLKKNWRAQAGAEIAGAVRYRRAGRSLVVAALDALATRQRGDHVGARRRFELLLTESDKRIENDDEDFGAWDYRAVALCGLHMTSGGNLSDAVAAIQRARSLSPSTPILEERLRYLLTQLDDTGSQSTLALVVEALQHPDRRSS